ncbi:hypothetical protein EBZ80_01150 [bacterium]|nr:hypothetical protein [bacterium]
MDFAFEMRKPPLIRSLLSLEPGDLISHFFLILCGDHGLALCEPGEDIVQREYSVRIKHLFGDTRESARRSEFFLESVWLDNFTSIPGIVRPYIHKQEIAWTFFWMTSDQHKPLSGNIQKF